MSLAVETKKLFPGRLAAEPGKLFAGWFELAKTLPHPEWLDPCAMTLSTISLTGRVSSRIVLCRDYSQEGVVFYTSYRSRKAKDALSAQCRGAAVLYWPHVGAQVRLEGTFAKVDPALSDAYFCLRPRDNQIGAWASRQSQPLASKHTLELSRRLVEKRFAQQAIPRPHWWGGIQLHIDLIEFWALGAGRLHERVCYKRVGTKWTHQRLYP